MLPFSFSTDYLLAYPKMRETASSPSSSWKTILYAILWFSLVLVRVFFRGVLQILYSISSVFQPNPWEGRDERNAFASWLKDKGVGVRGDYQTKVGDAVPASPLQEEVLLCGADEDKVVGLSASSTPMKLVVILYGTEYGASREIATSLFEEMRKLIGTSFRFILRNMSKFMDNKGQNSPSDGAPSSNSFPDLEAADFIFIICSTHGDGDPPPTAKNFYDFVCAKNFKFSGSTVYSVLAMGDKSYPKFCSSGHKLDAALYASNCVKLQPIQEVDQEDPVVISEWTRRCTELVKQVFADFETEYGGEGSTTMGNSDTQNSGDSSDEMVYEQDEAECFTSRLNPSWMKILSRRNLCRSSSSSQAEGGSLTLQDDKHVYHIEVSLDPSVFPYVPGDTLGLWVKNLEEDVEEILMLLEKTGSEKIQLEDTLSRRLPIEHIIGNSPQEPAESSDLKRKVAGGVEVCLRDALLYVFDIQSISSSLLKFLSAFKYRDYEPDWSRYTASWHLVDHMKALDERPLIEDLLRYLRPLQPRLFSISSSPLFLKDRLSLTVALVEYELNNGRKVRGVASSLLCLRAEIGQSLCMFMQKNTSFRLPESLETPIIMIGPGTGIAPFMGFMQHRMVSAEQANYSLTKEKNTLYFGCRNRNLDFLYKKELNEWSELSHLNLQLAFSREDSNLGKKVYVQDCLEKNAADTWECIKHGGNIYVCGDAKRMAGDVHNALKRILTQMNAVQSEEEAEKYLQGLTDSMRYQKDVW